MKIKPSLNESKDLVIDIGEVKVLDLKVANFIVNLVMKIKKNTLTYLKIRIFYLKFIKIDVSTL